MVTCSSGTEIWRKYYDGMMLVSSTMNKSLNIFIAIPKGTPPNSHPDTVLRPQIIGLYKILWIFLLKHWIAQRSEKINHPVLSYSSFHQTSLSGNFGVNFESWSVTRNTVMTAFFVKKMRPKVLVRLSNIVQLEWDRCHNLNEYVNVQKADTQIHAT